MSDATSRQVEAIRASQRKYAERMSKAPTVSWSSKSELRALIADAHNGYIPPSLTWGQRKEWVAEATRLRDEVRRVAKLQIRRMVADAAPSFRMPPGLNHSERKLWRAEASRLRAAVERLERAAVNEERVRAEERRLVSLMRSTPGASSAHRGVKSTWNTADPTTVRREPDEPSERLTDGKAHPVRVTKIERK